MYSPYEPKPFNEGFLPEQDGYRVKYFEYGNPNGPIIISLHGGPGSKSAPRHAAIFNLQKYRVVTFDQRGCGLSEPVGEISNNTTQDLLADIERLRAQLEIKTWFVFGGSWGATLALLYAEAHPEQVSGLLLASVYLGDDFSNTWAFSHEGGAAQLFPEVWRDRDEQLAKLGITNNVAEKLYQKITTGAEDEIKAVAAIVTNWELNLMTAEKDVSYVQAEDLKLEETGYAKIFLHYEVNEFFLEKNQIMEDIKVIRDIPTVIVHGRHDILCPLKLAFSVHQKLNQSELIALPQSNHKLTADGQVARRYAFDAFLTKNAT